MALEALEATFPAGVSRRARTEVTVSIGLERTVISRSLRSPPVRISPAHREPCAALPGLPSGIYPYLGGSVSVADLRLVVGEYGYATVSGVGGVKLARQAGNTLADPVQYAPGLPGTAETHPELFGYDEWLERQRLAQVPIILTDSPRIRKRDREALRAALGRWRSVAEPALVVLPIEPWWLKGGLPCLIDEVKSAQRPVALVLLHHYNGLDEADAVAGLVAFMSAIDGLPVVLMRCDVSAVGAVAYGGFAGFVGLSSTNRHGPMPRRNPKRDGEEDDPDNSPSVFVPALHDYVKASKLPSISRDEGASILTCHDRACGGGSLLRLARLSEVDLAAARAQAYQHNLASQENIAQSVFSSAEPKDAWWELCKSGADVTASLVERGISLSASRWLRQWLELGSPSHEPVSVP